MSKLLDRLERINRGTSTPMGFGAAARVEKLPSVALVGLLSKRHAEGASLLAKVGADGVLIQGANGAEQLKQLSDILGDLPWGVSVQELSEEEAKGYLEQGCDFFAFSPEGAALAALGEEEPGYLMRVPLDLEERALRAIEELPVDAILLSIDSLKPPLKVQHLIEVASVSSMFSKYFLLQVPGNVSPGELRGLRDIGVDGLIVDVSSTSEKALRGLKEHLMSVPRQRKSRGGRPEALVPRGGYRAPSPPQEDEEEEEEEE